jgi:hypothetical protein
MTLSRSCALALFFAGAALAQKVDLCHSAGAKFNPLSVNLNALGGHIGHGDALQPNGVVPGSPGYVFDANCNPVTWSYAANAVPDIDAQDPGSPGDLWAGSGIPATNFGIVRNETEGIELGLMIHYRQGPTVASTQSTANGSGSDSAINAAWNFAFSAASGLSAATDLNDHTYQLLYDVDAGPGVSYRTLTLEPGGAGASGFRWRDQDTGFVFINDDDGVNPTVTQNSENYAFAIFQLPLSGAYAPPFAGPARFDIILRALSGTQIVASNHIVVNVAP